MGSRFALNRLVLVILVVIAVIVVLGALQSRGEAPGSPSDSPISALVSQSPMSVVPGTASTGPSPAGRTAAPTRTPRATARAAGCSPTNQDRYVYNPNRLAVQAACLHVTGVVEAVRHEADGDLHILLALDAPYAHLLTPANQGVELGDLVIEPVCIRSVSQKDAIGTCAADRNPLKPPFPTVGAHVWMEGRYVLDLEHGGWAELHPLYRWAPG